ncbi:hypothetical protein ACJMK2_002378 [Sinanodonta woodiana]|uniref:Uncharacterized protein n=1 Tax=Sinanodonta woodiana TaxID=1069815 RepID=A0ABD3XVR5_SINWO
MMEAGLDSRTIIFGHRINPGSGLGTTLQTSTPKFKAQNSDMRHRIQQSHLKILEVVTRLAVELEAIQNAVKQRDRRMTTQVRNIGVDDVKCSPSGIVDHQAWIK